MGYPTQKMFEFKPVVSEISAFDQTNSSALKYTSIDLFL